MPVQTSFSDNISKAWPGLLITLAPGGSKTMVNAEASAEIAFGRAVRFERGGSGEDDDALLPSAISNVVAGIVFSSHAISRYELGTVGVKPGGVMNVLRRGEIWVVCEDGCQPGDKLWVRAVASGDPEFLGGLNNADDATDMINCTAFGEWQSTAAAGGLARLRVNFI